MTQCCSHTNVHQAILLLLVAVIYHQYSIMLFIPCTTGLRNFASGKLTVIQESVMKCIKVNWNSSQCMNIQTIFEAEKGRSSFSITNLLLTFGSSNLQTLTNLVNPEPYPHKPLLHESVFLQTHLALMSQVRYNGTSIHLCF